jgi:hypothetical protein
VILDSQPQSTTQDPGTIGSTNLVSNGEHVNNWIIDLGATSHMTYDPNDFKTKSVPRQQAILNANSDIYLVTGGGIMKLSTTFTLPNTLFVLLLFTKLLLVAK